MFSVLDGNYGAKRDSVRRVFGIFSDDLNLPARHRTQVFFPLPRFPQLCLFIWWGGTRVPNGRKKNLWKFVVSFNHVRHRAFRLGDFYPLSHLTSPEPRLLVRDLILGTELSWYNSIAEAKVLPWGLCKRNINEVHKGRRLSALCYYSPHNTTIGYIESSFKVYLPNLQIYLSKENLIRRRNE